MSKQAFIDKNIRVDGLTKIGLCNQIIEAYQEQGLRLTLRQLYYQLVTRNAITNEERSYKNLGNLVSDARLTGLMDWDAIEDRVRQPRMVSEFRDLAHLTDVAARSYRLPRWGGQENYVELWVEKDALAGVLQPLAFTWHVTLMVNRGYSSQSAMYEAAQRFNSVDQESKILFYLGDHDPSGEDMVRDIRDRLAMFGVEGLTVQKLALTRTQIDEHDPPPNPAKLTDSRATKYIEEHGNSSWEVDALPPEALSQIINDAFAGVVDVEMMDEIKKREAVDKKRLKEAVKGLMTK